MVLTENKESCQSKLLLSSLLEFLKACFVFYDCVAAYADDTFPILLIFKETAAVTHTIADVLTLFR